MNVRDYLLARLSGWGVKHVHGYPEDGINGLMGAFNRMPGNRSGRAGV